MTRGLRPHGYVGAAGILAAELLLYLRVEPVRTWYTPIIWSAYILFADGLVYRLRGSSLLVDRRRELLWLLPLSIGFWLVFEGYNLLLQNWYYVDVPMNIWLALFAYTWSFATIFPGLLETAELLEGLGLFKRVIVPPWSASPSALLLFTALGALLLTIPLLFPSPYLFGPVWVGFIFLLDPAAFLLKGNAFLADLATGRLTRILAWFVGGYLCGLFWEFWNYWAGAKWIYTVPVPPHIKIFEMPIAGFLGFGPFALEYGALYNLVQALIGRQRIGVKMSTHHRDRPDQPSRAGLAAGTRRRRRESDERR